MNSLYLQKVRLLVKDIASMRNFEVFQITYKIFDKSTYKDSRNNISIQHSKQHIQTHISQSWFSNKIIKRLITKLILMKFLYYNIYKTAAIAF